MDTRRRRQCSKSGWNRRHTHTDIIRVASIHGPWTRVVCTEHPWTRAVNTGVQQCCHFAHPCSYRPCSRPPVGSTLPVNTTRVHGPWILVFTGPCSRPSRPRSMSIAHFGSSATMDQNNIDLILKENYHQALLNCFQNIESDSTQRKYFINVTNCLRGGGRDFDCLGASTSWI